MSTYYSAPSTTPTNLTVDTPGDNAVIVEWSTTAEGVSGYTVSYVRGEVINTVVVSDPLKNNVRLTELTAGVEYSVTVQGFGDLPGPLSDPITVNLAGKLY